MSITSLFSSLSSDDHELYPPATEADVKNTEQALGRPLPPSFREFVTQFSNGAYLYRVQEVSAVGANPQIATIQKINLPDRPAADEIVPFREGGETTGAHLVPFSLDHNGNAWCFVTDSTSADGEYPVAYLDVAGRKLYGKQPSFAAWLGVLAETKDEVIRALYDQDVIEDELELG